MAKGNIQQKILAKILSSVELRYSEAKPPFIENDLYNYHLQFLVKRGLIKKSKNIYSLTTEGKYYVNSKNPLSPKGENIDRFKINTLTLVTKTINGNIFVLNQKRKRHPFYGHIGVMGGPIKTGEPLEEATSRNLEIETGLTAKFLILGAVRKISKLHDNNIFADTTFVLCWTDKFSGKLKQKTIFGENFWVDIDTAIKNETSPSAPTKKLRQILETLKANNTIDIPVFFDEEIQILKKF